MTDVMGLDFGTTNSALALSQNGAVQVIDISNQDTGEKTLPSVLFFDEDEGTFVGQQAIDQYLNFGGMYGRFLQSLKAYLSQPTFADTRIFGVKYELEDLVALILKEMKVAGERKMGHTIDTVMMGRPVIFSENPSGDALAQRRLEKAALRAGFKEIAFEYEPIAATLAYAEQIPRGQEQIVLMGDFGGGTSDFNVMRLTSEKLSQKEKKRRVLAVGGVYLGGDTFDSRIMWEKLTPHFGRNAHYKGISGQVLPTPSHLMRAICQWHRIPFLRDSSTLQSIKEIRLTSDNPRAIERLEALILQNKGYYIFRAIERAKKELSDNDTTRIHYRDPNIEIEEVISRPEFERIIAEDILSISACITRTLADAGVKETQIDRVLLTGGSSFVSGVRRLFEKKIWQRKDRLS